MGIKHYIGISALAIAVLSCKGRASDAPQSDAQSEHVDTVVTAQEQVPVTETNVDTVAQNTASDDGFPSTYEPPTSACSLPKRSRGSTIIMPVCASFLCPCWPMRPTANGLRRLRAPFSSKLNRIHR